MRKLIIGVSLAVGLLTGCWSPVAYRLQPVAADQDPVEQLKGLVRANAPLGCVSDVQTSGPLFTVQTVCSQGAGTSVARLDKIKDIVVEQAGSMYRCRVTHTSGAPDFWWGAYNLDDIQHMADAFAALRGPKQKDPAAKDPTASAM
jgi:hypothetical protein